MTQSKYEAILPTEKTTPMEMLSGVKTQIKSDAQLADRAATSAPWRARKASSTPRWRPRRRRRPRPSRCRTKSRWRRPRDAAPARRGDAPRPRPPQLRTRAICGRSAQARDRRLAETRDWQVLVHSAALSSVLAQRGHGDGFFLAGRPGRRDPAAEPPLVGRLPGPGPGRRRARAVPLPRRGEWLKRTLGVDGGARRTWPARRCTPG